MDFGHPRFFWENVQARAEKYLDFAPPPFSLENVQTRIEKLLKKYGLGSPPTLTPSPSPDNCPNMTLNCLNLEVTPPPLDRIQRETNFPH